MASWRRKSETRATSTVVWRSPQRPASFDALLKNHGEAGDLCRRLVLATMLDQFERATMDVQSLAFAQDKGDAKTW